MSGLSPSTSSHRTTLRSGVEDRAETAIARRPRRRAAPRPARGAAGSWRWSRRTVVRRSVGSRRAGAAASAAMTSARISGWSPSATITASGGSAPVHRGDPADLERAREAAGGIWVRHRSGRAPLDRGRQRPGGDDHGILDAGRSERVEDVLQDRLAVESRLELGATEPRAGPGGEHDRADLRSIWIHARSVDPTPEKVA